MKLKWNNKEMWIVKCTNPCLSPSDINKLQNKLNKAKNGNYIAMSDGIEVIRICKCCKQVIK